MGTKIWGDKLHFLFFFKLHAETYILGSDTLQFLKDAPTDKSADKTRSFIRPATCTEKIGGSSQKTSFLLVIIDIYHQLESGHMTSLSHMTGELFSSFKAFISICPDWGNFFSKTIQCEYFLGRTIHSYHARDLSLLFLANDPMYRGAGPSVILRGGYYLTWGEGKKKYGACVNKIV